MKAEPEQAHTGRLCSVYCPYCQKVTDKISWNLLREAGKVTVKCRCGDSTFLEYADGEVSIEHTYINELEDLRIARINSENREITLLD